MTVPSQMQRHAGKLRVLITGPAPSANNSLAEWLGEFEGIDIIGIKTRMVKALVLAEALKPDVVLLDFEMERASALNSVHLFREIEPVPAIVLLAQGVTDVIRKRCEEKGVTLVCSKTIDLDRLPSILLALQR